MNKYEEAVEVLEEALSELTPEAILLHGFEIAVGHVLLGKLIRRLRLKAYHAGW